MGNSSPPASLAAPSPVFLPQNPPSIRVVAVDGEEVPPNPTGGFDPTDISINAGAAVTVMIEARNVPVNATVQLHLFSENGSDQILDAPSLAPQPSGVLTATLNDVVIPLGFSRAFVRAKWTPQ